MLIRHFHHAPISSSIHRNTLSKSSPQRKKKISRRKVILIVHIFFHKSRNSCYVSSGKSTLTEYHLSSFSGLLPGTPFRSVSLYFYVGFHLLAFIVQAFLPWKWNKKRQRCSLGAFIYSLSPLSLCYHCHRSSFSLTSAWKRNCVLIVITIRTRPKLCKALKFRSIFFFLASLYCLFIIHLLFALSFSYIVLYLPLRTSLCVCWF